MEGREADRRGEYLRRIKSSAFFRELSPAQSPVRIAVACQSQDKCPFGDLAVLFRYSRAVKLMQKIHTLTDN
jgi:hypothetical protein